MADNPNLHRGHLDASGPREVVFCHQCEHEWFQDQSGLVCPRCESEITEIVTPESDPRPERVIQPPGHTPNGGDNGHPSRSPLMSDGTWGHPHEVDSDPEEADIEEHVSNGPGGSVLFSRTVRTSMPFPPYGDPRNRRNGLEPDESENVMRDFQHIIGNLMGPGFQPGQAGRSGANTLFTTGGPFGGQTIRAGGNGGPTITAGRFTFTTGPGLPGGRLQPRDTDGPQTGGGPPVDDLATILGGLFGGPPGQRDGPQGNGLPAGLAGLFSMLNPANARSGDAVYTQEALDQIISNLMEQHPTSNAPGPASPDAISSLPKKKLDEKELGPEGKGECSVCMDDVTLGVEVVVLPCSHWFHEACASAWLSEHNTCPICRKGIEGEATSSANSRRPSQSSPTSRNEHRARRLSAIRPRTDRWNSMSARNEARLDSIRNSGRMSPTEESQPSRRWPSGADPSHQQSGADEYHAPMPGAFYRRQSEMSENHRESRRGNTSGSDRSRESRQSSNSGNSGTGGGPLGWIRDRFGSNRRTE